MTIRTLINRGTFIGDPSADTPYAGALKLNALVSKTYVATAAQFGGVTKEATYTNTIAAAVADGVTRVLIPEKYDLDNSAGLPYNASLVTFNPAVKMIREGGWIASAVFDVRAYGAAGLGGINDTVPIQQAINAAVAFTQSDSKVGAIVWFDAGAYTHTGTIQVPALTTGSVRLIGAGMRNTYLYASGPSTNFTNNGDGIGVCLLLGSLTYDTPGTFTNQSQYCSIEDLSQNGSLVTSGSVVACQFTEMQYGWMRNSIIEAFPNNSIGLFLRGATVTSGVGQGVAGPHVRMCSFNNVLSTVGSGNNGGQPLVLQNADENTFIACTAAITTGQTLPIDTVFAVNIQMGRNNRFFGCLETGDTTRETTVGVVFGPPTNFAGAANGSVINNQFYGDVIEGHDRAMWFRNDPTGNTCGNGGRGINPSFVNTPFLDDNTQRGFGNYFESLNNPVGGGGPVNYYSAPAQYADALTMTGATPNVGGGNIFQTANGGATSVTTYVGGHSGQEVTVRTGDANTTFVHSAGFSLQGGVNYVATAVGHVLTMVLIASNWYEKSRRTP